MSTMADAEDAILQAKARFIVFLEEFTQQWDAPLRDTLIGASWAGADDATRAELAKTSPAAVDVMNNNYRRKT